jgi:hypothetical protein
MGFLLELRATDDDDDNEEDQGKTVMVTSQFPAVEVWD